MTLNTHLIEDPLLGIAEEIEAALPPGESLVLTHSILAELAVTATVDLTNTATVTASTALAEEEEKKKKASNKAPQNKNRTRPGKLALTIAGDRREVEAGREGPSGKLFFMATGWEW